MKRNLLIELFLKSSRFISRKLKWVGAKIIPAKSPEKYNFDHAKKYWHNVPRAQGGNPFNTSELEHMDNENLVREFDTEMEKARKKDERKLGFSLAFDSIASIKSPKVMDYGSGIGFYGFELMARHSEARVTFVDINDANLAIIRKIAEFKRLQDRVSYMGVRDKSAGDLIFDHQFDLIVSMGVLHHTPHAREIVENLTNFLVNGGVFQVMLYNYTYLRQKENAAGRRLNESGFGAVTDPVSGDISNPYSEAYDDEKAKKLFQGYELVSAHFPNPYYNTYRFKKISK